MPQPIPAEMEAWVLTLGQGEPTRKRVPVPKPRSDEVLLKILAMGVCHSDCTLCSMDEPILGMKKEFVLGHEACGEIVQLGSDVKASDFDVGDKVSILIIPGCNQEKCPQCSRGLNTICRHPDSGNYGLGFGEGMFAEYISIKSRAAAKIPDGVDLAQAAVAADAVLTSYHAVRYVADVQPDQTIAIFGLGGVGLNGLQTALHLGARRIFVVDKRQETLDEAMKLGVPKEDTFCTGDPNAKRIEQYVAENGIQVDTALDFVGHSDTFQSAQFTVRPGGTITVVGLISSSLPLIPMVSVMNALTIKCSYNGDRKSLVECLDLMAKGVLKPVVETKSVEELPQVLRDLDEGKVKSRMVLLPDWKNSNMNNNIVLQRQIGPHLQHDQHSKTSGRPSWMRKTSLSDGQQWRAVSKALGRQQKMEHAITTLRRRQDRLIEADPELASTIHDLEQAIEDQKSFFSSFLKPVFYNHQQSRDHQNCTAAQTVFDIPELLELILQDLRIPHILSFQQTCRSAKACIDNSPRLQSALSLRADPTDSPLRMPFARRFKGFFFNITEEVMLNDVTNKKITINFGFVPPKKPSLQRLPSIGSCYRRMYVVQPPITTADISLICCRTSHVDSPTQLQSESGITMGDVYDMTKDLYEKHSMCPRAPISMHDENGMVNVKICFSAEMRRAVMPPLQKRGQAEKAKEEAAQREVRNDRIAAYIAYKQQGIHNMLDGQSEVLTLVIAHADNSPVLTLEAIEDAGLLDEYLSIVRQRRLAHGFYFPPPAAAQHPQGTFQQLTANIAQTLATLQQNLQNIPGVVNVPIPQQQHQPPQQQQVAQQAQPVVQHPAQQQQHTVPQATSAATSGTNAITGNGQGPTTSS
ncbi:hypothetical protein LTR56_000124 [Elasticomyces elasticus]|nr:hypothetical protein LTR56_000124 [Elasticomyces elasticus]KAK3667112.1 hypothetical protein LTR22_001976 [Elasticomyces elasticus]KAK4932887.1 hypothetical protein LTR49_000843 [Elasticomyces elasticus]KAK5768709.1 hypothetical protein LTS12_001135 [Elasticomyces elasticus]